jgi:RNA polymerase sigma factor (sigma-70 family)
MRRHTTQSAQSAGSNPVDGLSRARACLRVTRVYRLRPVPPQDPHVARWFAEAVQPHEPALRAWLQSRFGGQCDIDDLVQEAYVRVLRAQATGEVQAPKAFLFATARNLALDRLRHERVLPMESLGENGESRVLEDATDVAESVARNQELALLTEAIQSLPDRCRQIFTLRTVYGMSQRDIGEKLGISDRTVAAQLAIGVARCTEFMLRRLGSRKDPR